MSIANPDELQKMVEAGRKRKGDGKDEDGYESDESIASVVDADININRAANDPTNTVVVAEGANQPIVKKKLAHFQKQTEADAEAERVAAGRRRRYSAPGNNVHSLLSFWKQKEQENVQQAAAGQVPKVKAGQVVVTSAAVASAAPAAGATAAVVAPATPTGAAAKGGLSAWQQREKEEKEKVEREKARAAQQKGVKWGAATATVASTPVPSAAHAAAVSRATVVPAGPSNYAAAGAAVVQSTVATRGVADYSSRAPEGVVETPAQIKARLKAEQLARDEKEKARAKQKGVKLTGNEKSWLDELARKEKAEREAAEARIRAAEEAKRKAEEEAAAALAAKLKAEREAKERAEREAREAEERRLARIREAEEKERARVAEEARLKAEREAAEEAERKRVEAERLERERLEREAAEQKAREDAARLAAIADAEAKERERQRQEEEARVEAERQRKEAEDAERRRVEEEQRKAEERKKEEAAERARAEAAKAAAAAAAEAEAKRAAEEMAAHAAMEAKRIADVAAVEEARRAAAKRAGEEEQRIRLEAERASRSSRLLLDTERLRIETAALERGNRERSGSTASLSVASSDGSDTPTGPTTPMGSQLAPPDLPSLPPPLPATLPPPMPPLPGLQPIGETAAVGAGFVPPPITTAGLTGAPIPGTPTTPLSGGGGGAGAQGLSFAPGTGAAAGSGSSTLPKSILKSPAAEGEKKPPKTPVALTPEEEEKAKKKAEKDAAQRVLVRAELISTEESYVKSLSVLVEQYCHPLKKSDAFDIPQNDVNAMFINVELLYSFHRVFLMDLSKADNNIATVVLKFADFLKMYTQYLNNYTKALETINAHRNNKKFQSFLEQTRKRNGMDIMSYLIMPVQRIPRYELLLKEILRLTPDTHVEHGGLEQAYGKIQGIAVHINEEKRKVENMTKLCEIQNRISGDFGTLLQPHRRLVREGTLIKVSHDLLSSQKQSQFFVFSDILLWTTQTHKYRGHMELTGLNCTPFKDKKGKAGFQIASTTPSDNPKKKHREETFLCADEKDANTWIADIHEAIKNLAADQQKVYARRAEERERRGAHGSIRHRVASTGGETANSVHSLIKQSLTDLKSLRGHDQIHGVAGAAPAAAGGGAGVMSPGGPAVPEPLLDIVASVQNPAAAGAGSAGTEDLKTPPAARPKHRRSITGGAVSPNA